MRQNPPLPFQPEFWLVAQHNPADVSQLNDVKGFITALPTNWTEGENVKFAFPTALVADNGFPASTLPGEPSNAVQVGRLDAASKPDPAKEHA